MFVDYFCAVDFGLLELTLRLASEGISVSSPGFSKKYLLTVFLLENSTDRPVSQQQYTTRVYMCRRCVNTERPAVVHNNQRGLRYITSLSYSSCFPF